MAFFGVTIEKIKEILPHPDPEVERLEIANLENVSFQFVVPKNKFQPNDLVVYFPIDAVIPEDVLEKLKLKGKLSGSNKNRVKTISLRGAISQGIVSTLEELGEKNELLKMTPDELTNFLKVTKYEPPVNITTTGELIGLPDGYSTYDIEGADRNQEIIDLMMDMEVVVFEKMEGTNHSCGKNNEKVFVNQRSNSIIETDVENSYWKVSRDLGFIDLIEKSELKNFSIYSEFCGPKIQNNIYKLPKHELFVFDIKVDYKWLSFDEFNSFVKKNNLKTAPILFEGKLKDFLEGQSIQEKSNGQSCVNPQTLREGIVVKPKTEQFHPKLGRLIIKQRSPKYLASSDN